MLNWFPEPLLEFYLAALGGELEIIRFGSSPAAQMAPPGWENKVLHGRLDAPSGTICVMDAPEERAGRVGDGNFLISIALPDQNGTADIFSKLSAGGTITMPLEKTFWSPMFGILVDKFGTKWMINCA